MNPYKCLLSYQENYNVELSKKCSKGLEIDVTGGDCDLGLGVVYILSAKERG